MSMATRRIVRLGEGEEARAVVVRELTLGGFRAWLKHAAEHPMGDPITALLFDDFDAADLCHFTNLLESDLEDLTPSEMRNVWDAVREVNADFFGMLGRVGGRTSRSSGAAQT